MQQPYAAFRDVRDRVLGTNNETPLSMSCLSVGLFVGLSVGLSVGLFVGLSVCPSVCLSVVTDWLSACRPSGFHFIDEAPHPSIHQKHTTAAVPELCCPPEAKRIKRELQALYKQQEERRRRRRLQQQQGQGQGQGRPMSRVPSSSSLVDGGHGGGDGSEGFVSPTRVAGAGASQEEGPGGEEGEWGEEGGDDDVFQVALAFMHDRSVSRVIKHLFLRRGLSLSSLHQ